MFQYQCPLCSNDMRFNTESGTLICDSCGESISITNISMPEYGNDKVSTYIKSLASTNVNEQTGDFEVISAIENTENSKPTSIIPFTITKSEAEQAFKKWSHSNHFVPKSFRKLYKTKGLTAYYIPVWHIDLYGSGELHAVGTRTSDSIKNKKRTTQSDYYDISRKNDYHYTNITVSASEELPNDILSELGTFNFQAADVYEDNNYSDYKNEKNDNYTYANISRTAAKACSNIIDNQVKQISHTMTGEIKGYSSVHTTSHNCEVVPQLAEAVLVPVWMFRDKSTSTSHNFFMNGQTGSIAGTPPVSAYKFAGFTAITTIVIFAIIQLILYFTGFSII